MASPSPWTWCTTTWVPRETILPTSDDYFTDRYRTPWGEAINFDGRHSDEVRRFFIENALHWVTDYHIDILRLDAIQMIFDTSARPFLRELAVGGSRARPSAEPSGACDRRNESERRSTDHTRRTEWNGLDGIWNDDFHHSLHALLTGERMSVYRDHGSLGEFGQGLSRRLCAQRAILGSPPATSWQLYEVRFRDIDLSCSLRITTRLVTACTGSG